jgi:hypothetical protein
LGFNFNNAPPSGPALSGPAQPAAPATDIAATAPAATRPSGAEAVRESGPPRQDWPVGSQSDPTSAKAAPPATSDVPQSASLVRFRSCRWMQPAENGNTEFCTHREVKPYAGTTGFDADAWCPECQYYKLRRAPKKRSPDDYSY